MESCMDYRELISAYIDDELKGKELRRLLLHLEGCSECKKEMSKLLTIREFVRKEFELAPGILPPQDFTEQVFQKIEEKGVMEVKNSPLLEFFINCFTRQVKVAAFVCTSVLIITFGIWFLKPKEKKMDNFLNIYELKRTKEGASFASYSEKDEKVKNVLFYHLRQIEASSLESSPGVIEYASYTSGYER
ncbi:MAG: zf-HC2 domain-containing protein [Thermodesulfobacteriota bacterium]|nr:zf-HC2 domain-containing protein [Thermodesulfobacteriota bacterium]